MSRQDGHKNVDTHYVKGYPSLAAFIASDTDKSTHVYRRFDRLGARNLLHLQTELAELEARQDRLDAEDHGASMEEKRYVRNWVALREKAAEVGNVREKDKLNVAMEVRGKIQQCQEAIILQSFLLSMSSPRPRVLEAFRNEVHNVKHPTGRFPTLGGHGRYILDDGADLMTPSKQSDEDQLSEFLRNRLAWLFFVRRSESPLTYISEGRIHATVAVNNVLMAAFLLFGAVINLYYVTSERKRLGLVAGYTVIFALCVGWITAARRAEIFAACAAYAAVLVVFIIRNLRTGNACKTCP